MTEVELIARETWVALAVGERPMPPDIALDRVQDATGDRDEAVTALCRAAVSWLVAERAVFVLRGISAAGGQTHDDCAYAADLTAYDIRKRRFASAHQSLGRVREACLRAAATDSRVENRAASHWMIWAGKAERTLRLIEELGRAARPEAGAA